MKSKESKERSNLYSLTQERQNYLEIIQKQTFSALTFLLVVQGWLRLSKNYLHIQSIWISQRKISFFFKKYSITDPEPWSLWCQITLNTDVSLCLHETSSTLSAMLHNYWKVLGISYYPLNCGLYENNLFFLMPAYSAENLSICLTSNVKQVTCCLWNRKTNVKLSIKKSVRRGPFVFIVWKKNLKGFFTTHYMVMARILKKISHLYIENRLVLLYHSRESLVSLWVFYHNVHKIKLFTTFLHN